VSILLIAVGNGATMRQAMADPAAAAAPVVSIHYSRSVGWAGHLMAEIVRAGESTAILDTNEEGGSPEIGVYRWSLGEARFVDLLKQLEASHLEQLGPPPLLQPGMKTASIGVRRAADQLPTLHTFTALPPTLAPTVRSIDAVIGELRKHPLRALRGQVSWPSAETVRGGKTVLTITLSNPGRQPLRWSNPLAAGGEWSGLRLVFSKKGADDEVTRDLTGHDLQAEPPISGPALLLPPGQTIVLRAHPKVDLPSGTYQARLEIHDLHPEENAAERIGGVLSLNASHLTVKRDGWWKVWR
jgi:hypothetical protein